jgi:uncharacterized protein (DUF885 family)
MRGLCGMLMLLGMMAPVAFGQGASGAAGAGESAEKLRQVAHAYYMWRNENDPVTSSDQGLHTWDDKLGDFSESAIAAWRKHLAETLALVKAMRTDSWPKEDKIDWLLFRSQLERATFFDGLLFERRDPQTYTNQCSNAIFSLLKKEYAPGRTRALAATARLKLMPGLLEQGKKNLSEPVRLYAQLAIESARTGDSLYTDSLAPIASELAPVEKQDFLRARDAALAALHGYAAWLEQRLANMAEFKPMGEAKYNYLLKNVYLLPVDAEQVAMLGQVELARYRALEALLPDPSLADPNPARSTSIPKDQQEFLRAYESREAEMTQFLRDRHLVSLPPYLGKFTIRQLPDAFKPTSPGGFMNPPGLYDADSGGFYFIPTYNPESKNFYIRAAIEDPRPILGHEGIPGHFLQISISNHMKNEIRREQDDGVFAEGWALYTEEMLMRTGLYPDNSAAQGQILHLSRYRAARVGVDVNLHCGKWTFEQGVNYFMDAGGLDREAAEGETAGAASEPTQKITYMVGKWQILRLLGRYRQQQGTNFQLGAFHDALLANGTLPLSVVQWILLDDRRDLDSALK